MLKNRNVRKQRAEILTGAIRGHGRRETCLVYAVRNGASDSTTDSDYKDLKVRDLPPDLEDGDYEVEVNGVTLMLRIDGAHSWIVRPRSPMPLTDRNSARPNIGEEQ